MLKATKSIIKKWEEFGLGLSARAGKAILVINFQSHIRGRRTRIKISDTDGNKNRAVTNSNVNVNAKWSVGDFFVRS